MERTRGVGQPRKPGITVSSISSKKAISMNWQMRAILLKFWLQRTMGYAAVANFCMLLYLVLDKFKLTRFWIPLLLVCIIAAIVFGYLEDKIGLARAEYELTAERMGLKK
jgi:cell division protein FtsW (lipid II flippase)